MTTTKRRSYTIAEKRNLVQRLRNGASICSLSRETGIDRKRLREWFSDTRLDENIQGVQKKRRLGKPGRKPVNIELDNKLLHWFRDQREKKISVNYKKMRKQIFQFDLEQPLSANFVASDGFLFRFTRRHRIGRRCVTHVGQEDKRPRSEILKTVEDYLQDVQQKAANYSDSKIFNMDETPCYFDMVRGSTLEFVGSNTVDSMDTGNSKKRFTVALTIRCDGMMVKGFIIFRGLKKVPKIKIPSNVAVGVNLSGTMDSRLIKQYLDQCFGHRGNYLRTTNCLLFWDSFGVHKKQEIKKELREVYGSQMLLIPPKTTHFLQPLDVGVNGAFKSKLKDEWEQWFDESAPEYTRGGVRKRPSYQEIVEMVSRSWKAITPETIKKSFRCCGIANQGQPVATEFLNSRLQEVLSWKEDEDDEFEILEDQNEELEDELVEEGGILDESEESFFEDSDDD